MAVTVTTPPADYPISLDEIKSHVRVSGSFDDTELTIYRNAAVELVQQQQKRQLITATLALTLDRWPNGDILLPRPPLISITSVKYIDVDGTTQTWAASEYEVDTASLIGRIHRLPSYEYPQIQDDRVNAVTIVYQAGYGTASTDVPDSTRHAIALIAAEGYEFHEPIVAGVTVTKVPDTLQSLINANALKEVI